MFEKHFQEFYKTRKLQLHMLELYRDITRNLGIDINLSVSSYLSVQHSGEIFLGGDEQKNCFPSLERAINESEHLITSWWLTKTRKAKESERAQKKRRGVLTKTWIGRLSTKAKCNWQKFAYPIQNRRGYL